MLKIAYFRNFKITAKFILWFLVIALLPLFIAIHISYRNYRAVLEQEITKSLIAVADNKANQIETYLREKIAAAVALSSMPDMIDIMQKFSETADRDGLDTAGYVSLEQQFRPFLTYYQKSSGYDDLLLIRHNGEILFSLKEKKAAKSLYEVALYKDSKLAKAFIKTAQSQKPEASDFEYDPRQKKVVVFIAAPVFNGSDFMGAVVLTLNTQGINELVRDYTGLGETGETVLAVSSGNEAVFISPLRFDPEAAFTRKIAPDSPRDSAIFKALQGEKGSGVSVDYRSQRVLAFWRYLPDFRLAMVVKMDTAEIFSSAKKLRNKLLMMSLVFLAIVALMAVAVARSISSPIKELTAVSATISGGNLSARAEITTGDEIGELARSFNQMTDSLLEAKKNVEQKKAEVEEQKKLLEAANHELDSFTYTVSHDLRAPLRGIVAFADFLEEDYKDKLDKEGQDHLKEIRDGAKRMEDLINDLLALSRISRIKNPYEDTDIGALIDAVIKRIEFDIKEHKVDLKIQPDMPSIKCDRIKMSEVFLNLINNAIKFSSKNAAESPKVEVGCIQEDNDYKFYVKDNGIGIDPQYHDKLFEIFKRLPSAAGYEGTGAGLSIVKRIIDDHQGKIWVDSQAGKGATFYFTIPKNLKVKRKIGEMLVEGGLITEQQLAEKLKEQERQEQGNG